jgi:hypothetical protein
MPETVISLLKGDSVSDTTDYRDLLPVNMIPVSRPVLGVDGYIQSHPGLTSFATGLGIDRGGYWNERQSSHFRVSGTRFISVGADGVVTDIGEIPGTGRASMAHSFNTQAIVANNSFYVYDGTAFNQIIDLDLGSPIDITWIDSYYFFTDGEFLYHTDITDETSIDPLKFATSEFSPDPSLGVAKTSDNQVIVFNRYTTEYFINRALDNFAFQRIQGKAVKVGIVGTHCKVELEGRFYVLGSGRGEAISIHGISSGTYQSIASREVDKVLAEYTETELQGAWLETRVEDRDRFIIVQLPRHTLLFNLTVAEKVGKDNAWTVLKDGFDSGTPWRGANGVFDPRVSGWIYGDNQDGSIGKLDNTVSTVYGNATEQLLYSPFLKMDKASIDRIEIDTIPGFQSNPDDVTVAMSLTYDGVSYGKEWWNLYGEQNKYGQRFIANRLGYVSDFVGLKFRCTSPERLAFSTVTVRYG